MTITVYSKPACVQCTATTRALDAKGLDYALVDLSEDERGDGACAVARLPAGAGRRRGRGSLVGLSPGSRSASSA